MWQTLSRRRFQRQWLSCVAADGPRHSAGRTPPASGAAEPLASGLCSGVEDRICLPNPTRSGLEANVGSPPQSPPAPLTPLAALCGGGWAEGATRFVLPLPVPTAAVAGLAVADAEVLVEIEVAASLACLVLLLAGTLPPPATFWGKLCT